MTPIIAEANTAGLEAITAQFSTVTSLVSNVFTAITGNAYLAVFAAAGLIAVGVHVFGLIKSAAR